MLRNHHKPFLILLILLLGFAFADDNVSEDDIVINVDIPVVSDLADETDLDKVGDDLYDLQEGAHDTITEVTGKEVKHFYVHLCLGKKACIPVDPFRFSN